MSAEPRRRQYVSILFRPGDTQRWTYFNDGAPVAIGDRVVVPSKRGESRVTVVAVDYAVPNMEFEIKPILRRVDDVPPEKKGSLI